MAIQLEQVVPFGRSLDEYIQMFNLTEVDRHRSILSVGDGPASFNAEGTPLGYHITSIDPLYIFSADQIRQRFDAVVDPIMQQILDTPQNWVWNYHASPTALKAHRTQVIEHFATDYPSGLTTSRYQIGALPHLNYPDGSYDLGLSSHFLFLYSDHFDKQFHYKSICEMLRVCQEIRIFPLLTLMLQPSPYLAPIIEKLQNLGFNCEIQTVNYELQRGGNQMLRITHPIS